jgi:hypothetical protein
VEAPPKRPETVAHVEETGAEALGTRIEADPIVGDFEAQPAALLLDVDVYRGAFPRVLGQLGRDDQATPVEPVGDDSGER